MAFNCADFYDAELKWHNDHLRAAARIEAHHCVLDIGCGAGQTACEAAHIAVKGSVLGVDVSAQMLEIARQRSTEQGLRNVTFEQGDAQRYAFPPASFDLCISRFGAMFFADPTSAFTNIRKSMRLGGRLVWMVWQSQDRNQWATAIRQALASEKTTPAAAMAAFSLGEPATTAGLLKAAGFTSIDFAEVQEPVFYGPDVNCAYDALIGLQFSGTGAASDGAKLRLRELLGAHLTAQGVLFNSRAWLVTAQCATN